MSFGAGLLTGVADGMTQQRDRKMRDRALSVLEAAAANRPAPGQGGGVGNLAMSDGSFVPAPGGAVAEYDLGTTFADTESQYGLPSGYLDRTYTIESGRNPNAQNENSSAGGGFQFIDSTAKAYGLSNKFDLRASADAAARFARDNTVYLTRVLGRAPDAAELYLAHQQGAGGAAKLLANPNARAVDIVGADAVRLNGGTLDMTAGQFAAKWTGKFGRPRQAPQPSAPEPAQTATPAPGEWFTGFFKE